ncbi:hypothetical protein CCHL11_04812 [Colletotrichum chlorophyti]|uniref:Uncharacterized protein n=1 Tax=Colletotrichum chlorophyti TaxID=708187 RepID=A0A1Q8S1L1_9PEZI|nr:hypothetical protein CCHL11_04812 [Colletotrichum chlorophyti]
MPSLPHRPALAPRDGISSFASGQSSDSYYSDRDINILHHVVATAQENLNLLPEGERLATNALFQAYDDILPTYGIDPEEEHHISRLVFRVGGERGDKSLLGKLHAVLERMGIGLDLGSSGDGSAVVSDHGENKNYQETSPASSALAATEDEFEEDDDYYDDGELPSERVQGIQPSKPARSNNQPQSLATKHNEDSESPPRLTRANLAPTRFDSKPIDHDHHPKETLQSYTPSTAGDTEQTHHSHQSGPLYNGNLGASDTTVQPVDSAKPQSNISENEISVLPTLPVRSKPARTVNWLLPPENITVSFQNGRDLSQVDHEREVYEPDAHKRDTLESALPLASRPNSQMPIMPGSTLEPPKASAPKPETSKPAVYEPEKPQPGERNQPTEKLLESGAQGREQDCSVEDQPEEDPAQEARRG